MLRLVTAAALLAGGAAAVWIAIATAAQLRRVLQVIDELADEAGWPM